MKTPRSFLTLDARLEQGGEFSAEFLDQLAADWPADDALLGHLVAFAEGAEPDAQTAATGLLRRYLQAGARLPEPAAARLLELLPALSAWEARLHVLQTLPVLPISAAQADALMLFLERCLTEPNKFIRAWAYGGLHRVASLHPRYRATVRAALERAGREEAPSVRARLRRLTPLTENAHA